MAIASSRGVISQNSAGERRNTPKANAETASQGNTLASAICSAKRRLKQFRRNARKPRQPAITLHRPKLARREFFAAAAQARRDDFQHVLRRQPAAGKPLCQRVQILRAKSILKFGQRAKRQA